MNAKIEHYDLAVVGGGVIGLACAYAAAKRKQRVLVLERDGYAQSASIRNFGMIWPIGQPAGELFDLAMESRALWLELTEQCELAVRQCGSLHVAHFADEWNLLQEFAAQANQQGYQTTLLNREQTLQRSSAINPQGLQGGLYSATECGVDPPRCIQALTKLLSERWGATVVTGAHIIRVQPHIESTDGRCWHAHRIVVASGSDMRTLYPDHFQRSGLRLCKLHMMSTVPQANGHSIGPHLASGLTLRHYSTFRNCPSLQNVQSRIAQQWPELDRWGIHVMISQPEDRRVILGDSHEYDEDITPFQCEEIDNLIMTHLQRVFQLPNWTVARRWVGYYVKNPADAIYLDCPCPSVRILTGLGGNGMTLSMAVGERLVSTFDNPRIV